jgi:hypothetical protein
VLTHGKSTFSVLLKPEHDTAPGGGGVVVPPTGGTNSVTDVVGAQAELQAVSWYVYDTCDVPVLAGSVSLAVDDVEQSVWPFLTQA